jgi:hypothetical protein
MSAQPDETVVPIDKVMIDSEISNLCVRLKDDERAQLEENIKAGGCRDALVMWGKILLDGHNRHEICRRLGIRFKLVQAPGITSRGEAVKWVIDNQLGRRNLTPLEISYLSGKRYEAEKMTPTEQHSAAGSGNSTAGKIYRPLDTDAKLASEIGVSPKTIRNDATFAKAVDSIAENVSKEASQSIRSGKSKLTKTKIVQIGKLDPKKQRKAFEEAIEAKKPKKAAKKEKKSPGDTTQRKALNRALDAIDRRKAAGEEITVKVIQEEAGVGKTVVHEALALREVEANVEAELPPLSATYQKKLEAWQRKLEKEFDFRVRMESQKCSQKWLNEVRIPMYEKKMEELEHMLNWPRNSVMTLPEYKKILMCLHPDGVHSRTEEQLTEGFRIFTHYKLKMVSDEEAKKAVFKGMPTFEEMMTRKGKKG